MLKWVLLPPWWPLTGVCESDHPKQPNPAPSPNRAASPESLCTWPTALWKVCASEAKWDTTRHCISLPTQPRPMSMVLLWPGRAGGLSGAQESVSLLSSCYSFNISCFLLFHGLILFYSQYGILPSFPYNSGSSSLSWGCPISLLPCYHSFPPELGGETLNLPRAEWLCCGRCKEGICRLLSCPHCPAPSSLWDFLHMGAEAEKMWPFGKK